MRCYPIKNEGGVPGLLERKSYVCSSMRPKPSALFGLLFKENQAARTQEFLLRWLSHGTALWRDAVRQQWNFSPPRTAKEREKYRVDPAWAAALVLNVSPDVFRGAW